MQGKVLAGRYRLESQLGQGGMGSVWRAEHLTLHSAVAIKLMDPAIAETPEGAERFRREAQAAASLRSTHVVQVLDYGVEDGTPYLVMELLQGESLAACLEREFCLTPGAYSCHHDSGLACDWTRARCQYRSSRFETRQHLLGEGRRSGSRKSTRFRDREDGRDGLR